jgi:hypothetical protein
MAVGDLFWFDHALYAAGGLGIGSSAFSSGDIISLGLNTTAGVTSTSTGSWDSYTEATTGHQAGGYPSSGTTMAAWGDMWSKASAEVSKFDTAVSPNYTQSTLHSTSVNFAIGYNYTQAGANTLFAIDLGDVDMTAGDLTITFNASGIATVTSTGSP